MKEFYPEGNLLTSQEDSKKLFTPSALASAQACERVLESTAVMCDAQHNLVVDLGCMEGIIPRTEGAIGISEGTTRDIALISRVGRPVSFIITDFKYDSRGKKYAVLSRRLAQEKCKKAFFENIHTGDVIDAKITHLESFGAFCDIGCGNPALLPIDSISVSRISHPRDRFCVGDDIHTVVKSIGDDGKITLSLKELLGTWQENADMFSQGQTVSGVIRSIENYGVFVELTANLAGLAEPRPDVYIGQKASVYIKSIIPEKMKIKLVIIDSFDDDYRVPLRYFCNDTHVSEFNYSPEICCKQISSRF